MTVIIFDRYTILSLYYFFITLYYFIVILFDHYTIQFNQLFTKQLLALKSKRTSLTIKMAEGRMSSILDNLGLPQIKKTFSEEKITADIVGKLSLVEFAELGLTSRKSIMELRVECTVYGQEKPRKETNPTGGAPELTIPKEIIQ